MTVDIQDDIDDATLGRLSYDAGLNCLSFRVAFGARRVWIQLSLDSCDDVTALIAHGRSTVSRLTELESAAAAAVAPRLTLHAPSDRRGDPANDAWRELRAFRSRFELESVMVYPDGQSSMTFDDGGLYAGQVVLVSLSRDGRFADSCLA